MQVLRAQIRPTLDLHNARRINRRQPRNGGEHLHFAGMASVSPMLSPDPHTCRGELTHMGTFAIELIPAAWLQKAKADLGNQKFGKHDLGLPIARLASEYSVSLSFRFAMQSNPSARNTP